MANYFEPFKQLLKSDDVVLEVGANPSIESEVFLSHSDWKDSLPNLGIFDAIFYHENHPAKQDAGNSVLQKIQALLSSVYKQIPHLTSMSYTDQDIENFYRQVGHLHQEEVGKFLFKLKENKQISSEQYQSFAQKYNLSIPEPKITRSIDSIFSFFQICSDNHMRKGSCFFGFSTDPTPNYENPQFFEHIIANPHLEYEEKAIPEGLIFSIKKI